MKINGFDMKLFRKNIDYSRDLFHSLYILYRAFYNFEGFSCRKCSTEFLKYFHFLGKYHYKSEIKNQKSVFYGSPLHKLLHPNFG